MNKVSIDKQAEKYLKKLDAPTRKRILNGILELAENPFSATEVKRLKGTKAYFRKRVGRYRIIFKIEEHDLTVVVLRIGARGDVYK